MRTSVFPIFLVLVLVFVFREAISGEQMGDPQQAAVSWKTAELTDVRTGKKFRISDFAGKPILVETFAVWCPTCRKQQDQIRKLHQEIGEAVISVSLDTDPNESENSVKGHLARYGYEWLFAVVPPAVTQSLVADFGLGIINAPGAPVVLVCEDLSTRFLRRGVKKVKVLRAEIEQGCLR